MIRNRYRVVGFLGQGGYGDVYEVKDMQTENSLALKIDTQGKGCLHKEHKILKAINDHYAPEDSCVPKSNGELK